MKNRVENAVTLFDNGFNCAQSVVSSFLEEINLDKDIALRLSCGFGGGMGRMEEVCGAVTGGIFVIGAKYGKDTSGNQEDINITYANTRELMNSFSSIHGTYICRTLIKNCDLTTDEGQQQFKELDLKNKVCKQCITTVVEKLEELI